MALSNITREDPVEVHEYRIAFEYDDMPGAGYGFPCNEDGSVDLDSYEPPALENLALCLFGLIENIHFVGIEDRSYIYTEPRHGTCKCGREVYLTYDYGHGIDCECGRIYNSSGQELAPRSQWEDRYDEDSTQPYNVEFGYALEDY